MYQSLDVFQTAAQMAKHAGSRQAVVARNIANADTPRFQAMSMPAFQEVYSASDRIEMRATRANHLDGGTISSSVRPSVRTDSEPSPNGNSVSLEEELLNSVDVSREHNRALTIYRHAMTVLKTTLGK